MPFRYKTLALPNVLDDQAPTCRCSSRLLDTELVASVPSRIASALPNTFPTCPDNLVSDLDNTLWTIHGTVRAESSNPWQAPTIRPSIIILPRLGQFPELLSIVLNTPSWQLPRPSILVVRQIAKLNADPSRLIDDILPSHNVELHLATRVILDADPSTWLASYRVSCVACRSYDRGTKAVL
jgi:hypothetical protein